MEKVFWLKAPPKINKWKKGYAFHYSHYNRYILAADYRDFIHNFQKKKKSSSFLGLLFFSAMWTWCIHIAQKKYRVKIRIDFSAFHEPEHLFSRHICSQPPRPFSDCQLSLLVSTLLAQNFLRRLVPAGRTGSLDCSNYLLPLLCVFSLSVSPSSQK